jgi:hypothetical protein
MRGRFAVGVYAHQPRERPRRTVWVLVGVSSLMACTAETPDSMPAMEDSYRPVSRPQLLASMIGIATGDQSRVVDVSLLVEEEAVKGVCMREAGFDYVDARPDMLTDFAPQTDVHDPAFARAFGLGISVESFGEATPNPNDRTILGLSDAEADSWYRRQATCDDIARSAVSERLSDLDPMLRLADEVNQRARTDPRFLEAQAEWKQCMSGAGIEFGGNSYVDLFNEFLERYDADPATYDVQAEIAAAVASAECDGEQWTIYRRALNDALAQIDPAMSALVEAALDD